MTEIVEIERRTTARFIPNAIHIATLHEKVNPSMKFLGSRQGYRATLIYASIPVYVCLFTLTG